MVTAITRRHQDIKRFREAMQREKNIERFNQEMGDIFADRSVSLSDFRLRPLFEALVDDGAELVQSSYNPHSGGGYRLQEAGVVDTSLFANIQGQYLYNAILRAYEMPELIGDSLVDVQSSVESGERIPGVTEIGDNVEVVAEGQPYPTAAVSESWIQTPETIKRGLLINITKEAVFFDKTNLILSRAANIGRFIAINREKRILDVVLGLTDVYSRNGGAVQATFQAGNTSTSNALTDWASLDKVDTVFSGQVDPDTGEPIVTTADVLIVPPSLRNTAMRIANGSMTNQTGGTRETRVAGNSLNQPFRIATNQYVRQRTGSATTWFYGNPKAAFVYMQNWPLTVEQEGANSEKAFESDIIARYKASERGAAGVVERLYMAKATA